VVIDLARLPSHGRALGVWLRQQKATRDLPLVFIAGDPEKTARVKALLPDAVYCNWRGIRGALHKACAGKKAAPARPGIMAAYSGTPLPRKLGIRPGAKVALLAAPAGFEKLLSPLPPGVSVRRAARGRIDVALLFARSRGELDRRFGSAARAIDRGGRLWIAWPKKASGVVSDLTQAAVRAFGLERGMVDFKIAALDATWSGLCFVPRRAKED